MDSHALVLLTITLAALAGTFFTVVPLLPGTLFVPLGAVVCALIRGWDTFAWWFWAVQLVLVVAYVLIDNLAQLHGVRRAGGSRQAMIGGAVGVFVGPLLLAAVLGPLALFLGPPVGAVAGTLIGEERARRRASTEPVQRSDYHRLGFGALLAFVVGTSLKLATLAVQVLLLWFVAR